MMDTWEESNEDHHLALSVCLSLKRNQGCHKQVSTHNSITYAQYWSYFSRLREPVLPADVPDVSRVSLCKGGETPRAAATAVSSDVRMKLKCFNMG